MVLLNVNYPVGGIRTYISYLYSCDEFKKDKFIMLVPKRYSDDNLEGFYKNIDLKIIYYDTGYFRYLKSFVRVLYTEKIQLVHSHGYTSGALCAFITAILRVKHIMTCHDVFNKSQFAGLTGKLRKIFLQINYIFITRIHTVSDDVKDNLLENLKYLNINKIVTIPNGLDIKCFINADKRDLRKELSLGRKSFLIGFFGRFMNQKGFRYLVEAVNLLEDNIKDDKELYVIAVGDGGYKAQEIQYIKDRDLEKYFIFLPKVENPATTMACMDLIVMPSLWEASGLVAMEALVLGVPLIATNCIGLRLTIKNTPTCVVEPGDSNNLSAAIKEIVIDNRKEEFMEFSSEAIKRFDINAAAKKIKSLYMELISE